MIKRTSDVVGRIDYNYFGVRLSIPFIGTDLSEKSVKISCNGFIVNADYYDIDSYGDSGNHLVFLCNFDMENDGVELRDEDRQYWEDTLNSWADKLIEEAVITIEGKTSTILRNF